MSLLKGTLTVRRYRAQGEVPADFRERFQEALQDHAFREPKSATFDGETVGWVLTRNLLEADFSNHDHWLFNQYLCACLRVDKKVLPAKLVRAHVEQRVIRWCTEHDRERAPGAVKSEIKEAVQAELMLRCLPRVAVHEFCWNVADGWVLFLGTSQAANDRFRKLFRATFGVVLMPWSPLDFLQDVPELAQTLEVQGLSDFGGGVR